MSTVSAVLPTHREPDADSDSVSSLTVLRHAIEHAAHLLPAQGPIQVFIHHNTLHAFEHLPFDVAVREGGNVYGCQPYLSEEQYRQRLEQGRIAVDDLAAVLRGELTSSGEHTVTPFARRFDLRLGMLVHRVRQAPSAELRWFIAETDALTRLRCDVPEEVRTNLLAATREWVLASDDLSRRDLKIIRDLIGQSNPADWPASRWEAFTAQALWRVCREGVHGHPLRNASSPAEVRHRDVLLDVTGIDTDPLVHEPLIRFCAAFADQGLSRLTLPKRELGFFAAFAEAFRHTSAETDWLAPLPAELQRVAAAQMSPLEIVQDNLEALGISEREQPTYIQSTLLALRGWAGMLHQLELRGERMSSPVPSGTMVEFLAARLLLDRFAITWAAREGMGYQGPLSDLRTALRHSSRAHERIGVDQRAFTVFQIAQALGWSPGLLHRMSRDHWRQLLDEVEQFSAIERRRIFHAAFERHYRNQALDAVALHQPTLPTQAVSPRFQLVCCLDEREESFRRHLEEVAPQAETFGAAGFFNVPMLYRGAADAAFVPLAPIVVTPRNLVEERVAFTDQHSHRRRALARRLFGLAAHRLHIETRGLTGGAFVAASFGAIASIPLVMRVLFPRLTARLRRLGNRVVQPPPRTHLDIERTEATPGCSDHDHDHGFTVPEMAGMVERLLRDIGLVKDFARLVIILGHGSSSLNNPHSSAYNCGACGGGAGGPNARAICRMANDPRVRLLLAERGVKISDATWFVGGLHNTCDDSVTYFDIDAIPRTHHGDFAEVRGSIDASRSRNAHERCRRFDSASPDLSFDAALRHVEARSEDLAQVRPECGHATNAICFVGRRARTRGLFMDRRTFLTSYDPTQDDVDSSILTRILQAAVPVCAGINLEYYFSYVDPIGYGCGTKLPHNVTSLIGVMDGAASDLRTGLPWQMVEIHEPMRLLFIVETTAERMLRIMDANPVIARLCRNGWVQLAVLSPESNEIRHFVNGSFVSYLPEAVRLPAAPSSLDWYRGKRDHLGFASIKPQDEAKTNEPA